MMTAKKKVLINAKRKAKVANGAVKRATKAITRDQRRLSDAQADAQLAEREARLAKREARLAEREAQIAVLKGESPVASGVQRQTQSSVRKVHQSREKVQSIDRKRPYAHPQAQIDAHPYAQIDAHPHAQIDAHPYAQPYAQFDAQPHTQPYSQMDAQLATIEEKIAALHAQSEEMREQRAEIRAQSKDLHAQKAELRAKIAERKAQRAEMQVRKQAKRADRLAQLDMQQEQNAPLQAQNASLQAQLAQMQAQIAMLMGQDQSSTFNARSRGQDQSSTFNAPSRGQAQSSTFNARNGGQDQSSTFNARSRDQMQSASTFKARNGGQVQSSTFKARSVNSALPKANLPAPVLGDIVANGPNSITLHWGSVANASAYIVSVADNSAFEDANLFSAGPGATSWTVNGLEPNTTYYVRIRANGSGEYGNSAYSASKSITTTGVGGGGDGGGGGGGGGGGNGNGGENGSNETDDAEVAELQSWMSSLQTGFQNVAQLVPQLDGSVMDAPERRRLLGSGVRRYGFIEKVMEVSSDYPQFWPAFFEDESRLRTLVNKIDILRNLLVWFRYAARIVGDLLLLTGDDAFRIAGSYYAAARDGARRRIPEAMQVYQLLRLYWKRRRRAMQEPTEKEMLRDFKGLMHGTKDGDLTLYNESDRIVRGKKGMIDNTFPANQRASMKVMEEEDETGAGAEWFDRTGTPGSKAGGRELGKRRKKKKKRNRR